ncbi:LemA family protein [Limosilactobacillus caecicola]|uniref:LemA family protein n=1 Tax=Limosilactobacillus caecicola TaxID=2941332 RepID=UPI00203BB094|nr:LemA family protein [Limosilactobacillus caecicola]
MTTIIILIIVVVLILIYISIYNGLVRMRTNAQESWSQIDVQLQRRNDLIPNLVNTVKGYSKYEAKTLEKVTALRQQVAQAPADDPQAKMAAADKLTGALNSLYAVAENYPDLKASAEFSKLMEELSNTENKIAYSRQLYNSTVAAFDAKILTFPANLVAKLHHFTKLDYLQVPEKAKQNPQVDFSDLDQ